MTTTFTTSRLILGHFQMTLIMQTEQPWAFVINPGTELITLLDLVYSFGNFTHARFSISCWQDDQR